MFQKELHRNALHLCSYEKGFNYLAMQLQEINFVRQAIQII